MNHPTLNILDLCDELLLIIFNKLDNINVLYSFVGVNKKLDRLARDITFTRSIDLVTNENNDSILNRFIFDIIPRIQHNIECLTLDPLPMDHILHVENYPKLRKVTLVDLKLDMTLQIFNGMISVLSIFKDYFLYLFRRITMYSQIETSDYTFGFNDQW
jgi:hypothetical protein